MMKPMTKTLIAAGLLSASVMAEAGLSANIGAMSDYWFRGANQTSGASMMGGLDYEADNGLYVGTWAAGLDDDDVEVDLYAGYAGEAGDFSYSVGYTGFFYTEGKTDFHELNFGLGYSFVSLEVTFGTEDRSDQPGVAEADYTFIGLTGEYEGAYATYGTFGDDADGDYFEVGYGTTYEGLDMGVAYITGDADSDPSANNFVTDSDTLTVYISKSFDL